MNTIHMDPTLAYSKAFNFIIQEWHKMLVAGTSSQEICFSNSTSVVYATDEKDEVIGAILFSVDQTKRQGWIYLGAVAERMRQKGVYSEMYDRVESECRAQGAISLSSNVHVSNTPMLEALRRFDREPAWLKTIKKL
jgi:hypothetical protein